MSKSVNEGWLENLVKNYKIPTPSDTPKSNKILTESQLKIIQNGKDKKRDDR
jgi:hypothetical protein